MDDPSNTLKNCQICPRRCGVDRFSGEWGYCRSDAGFNIGAICRHGGEEPVLGGAQGICNVFFTHCNLQCRYCQNVQISRNQSVGAALQLEDVTARIIAVLDRGISTLGFVAPSHHLPQMAQIIRRLHQLGRRPVVVYNTSAYDRRRSLQAIADLVDIYLPDFKYLHGATAAALSDAADYPAVASRAIAEMLHQKGATLVLDDQGAARRGVIIRHLVLPGHVSESIELLAYIARTFSPEVHVSLMAQYYPTAAVQHHPLLGRTLTRREYDRAVAALVDYGFENGWIQERSSAVCYRPDFAQMDPFA